MLTTDNAPQVSVSYAHGDDQSEADGLDGWVTQGENEVIWHAKACAGPHSRQRIFTVSIIFWAFLSQILSPKSSCREALRKICALFQLPIPVPIAGPGFGGLWLKSLADPCKRAFPKLFNRSFVLLLPRMAKKI
jgi:hypothetical protein